MTAFDIWDELLYQYVSDRGRVDYTAWKQNSAQTLDDWLVQLPVAALQASDANHQLTLWLNLYNALTIQQVLRRYPIASIQPKVLGIPNWIAFLQFFSRPVYELQGQTYSLNKIEHGILRQQFSEPRIHFALVCASVGCPLLRNEAYKPDRVQAQLQEDTIRFIHNPEKVRYDEPSQKLYCSMIFKWYQSDFLKVASSVPTYIQSYLPAVHLNDSTPIHYFEYDWSLNDQRMSS